MSRMTSVTLSAESFMVDVPEVARLFLCATDLSSAGWRLLLAECCIIAVGSMRGIAYDSLLHWMGRRHGDLGGRSGGRVRIEQ